MTQTTDTRRPVAQLPPAGPMPDSEMLFTSGLLWPRPGGPDVGPVLALVANDDIADPATAEVVKVIRSMIYARQAVSPVLVADEIRRAGGLSPLVADRLREATTAGAVPEAVPQYAAAVVALSLRRRMESAGNALTTAAASMAESDLAPLVERAAAGITDCAARLEKLRSRPATTAELVQRMKESAA